MTSNASQAQIDYIVALVEKFASDGATFWLFENADLGALTVRQASQIINALKGVGSDFGDLMDVANGGNINFGDMTHAFPRWNKVYRHWRAYSAKGMDWLAFDRAVVAPKPQQPAPQPEAPQAEAQAEAAVTAIVAARPIPADYVNEDEAQVIVPSDDDDDDGSGIQTSIERNRALLAALKAEAQASPLAQAAAQMGIAACPQCQGAGCQACEGLGIALPIAPEYAALLLPFLPADFGGWAGMVEFATPDMQQVVSVDHRGVRPAPEYQATPLAQALPMDACPQCNGTGKPETVFGGQRYGFGGQPIYDGATCRPYCKHCGGFGVEPEILRAIYEGESLECAAIVGDAAIEAALKEVTGFGWSEWEDEWAEQDEQAAYEARHKGNDDAFDAWRDYRAGA